MYTLIKISGVGSAVIDSDFDLGIMITLCHLNRQLCPADHFRVVDDKGLPIWPAA
jgi:hypothetical protein